MISRRDFLMRIGRGTGAIMTANLAPYLPKVYDKSKVKPASTVKVISGYADNRIISEFISGDKIAKGQVVTIHSNGKVYPIDFSNPKQQPIGVALDDATIMLRSFH